MPYRYNAITGELDLTSDMASSGAIIQIDTDSGSATPTAGVVDLIGDTSQGVSTSGATNVATITVTDSTTTQKGVVELATDAEAVALVSTDKSLVPSNLTPVFAEPPPIGSTTPNSGAFSILDVDNIRIDGNTISSTDTNGMISLSPNGTGGVVIPTNLTVGETSQDVMFTINGVAIEGIASLHASGVTDLGGFVEERHSDTASFGAHQLHLRTRGVEGAPTIVQNGDAIARAISCGYDGTDYSQSAEIRIEIDGVPGADDMPGRIKFLTSPSGTQVPVLAMTIDSAQDVTVAQDLTLTAGNLILPATASANSGVVKVGANRWLHNFGTSNIFLGDLSGNYALSGSNNVCVGQKTGEALAAAVQNVLIGGNAGNFVTSGNQNVAIGYLALFAASTGQQNVAMGYGALQSGNSSFCVGVGLAALQLCSGHSNVALGANAGRTLTTGTGMTAIGHDSCVFVTGDNNTGLGEYSLNLLTTGAENTAIGRFAGNAYTGAESSNVCLHNVGVLGESNTIHIGTQGAGAGQQDTTFIAGIAQVAVSNPESVFIDTTTGQLGSFPSNSLISVTALTTASTPYTTLAADYYFTCDVSGGVLSILMPDAPTTGRVYVVKDSGGDAGTNNITVTSVSGVVTIDGATTFVMNTNYQSAQFLWNGASYEVF